MLANYSKSCTESGKKPKRDGNLYTSAIAAAIPWNPWIFFPCGIAIKYLLQEKKSVYV